MYIRRSAKGRYKCEIHLPNGKKFSRTFDTRRDAERWGRSRESELDRGDFIDPARGRIRLEDWAWESLKSSQQLAPSTRARYEIAIRRDISPALGGYRLAALDHEAVQGFVNSLVEEGKAPGSVRKSYNVLTKMMRLAVSAGRITRSPCVDVQLPRISPQEMRFLSPREVQYLTEQFDDRFKPLISAAAYLGLRWSELIALRTKDVVLPARRLSVTHTLVEVNGRLHEGPPKTAKGLRSMTIPGFLADAIGEHIGRFPSRDGHIFSAAEGGPIRKSFVRRQFKPAAKAANLLPLRVHDLRHTAAGLMIALGAHPKVIQERLGHSSIKVTLDTYGHLFPNLDEALAHGLDELARSSAASAPPAGEVVVSLPTG